MLLLSLRFAGRVVLGVLAVGAALAAPLRAQAQALVAQAETGPWTQKIQVDLFASLSYVYNTNRPASDLNQYRVFDDAAALFAASLYGTLADGIPVAAALREARSGLAGALGEDALDWAVPVLYARDPGAVLCRPSVRR